MFGFKYSCIIYVDQLLHDSNQTFNIPVYTHIGLFECVSLDGDPDNIPIRNYPSCITLWSLSIDFRLCYSQNIDRAIIWKGERDPYLTYMLLEAMDGI